MSEVSMKPCPACCESIQSKAKKCPYCQHWQSPLNSIMLLGGLPTILLSIAFAMFLGIAALVLRPLYDEGRDFGPHRTELVVVESEMTVTRHTEHPRLLTVGVIRNDSPFPWCDIEIEVQFFDIEGQLIDTSSVTSTFRDTIASGDSRGFSEVWPPQRPIEDYASHKVYVRWAQQPPNWPWPF